MAVELPHFTLPFQWVAAGVGDMTAAVADQETIAEIGACVEAIIRTVQGQRTTLPEFGHPELEFNVDPELARSMLAQAIVEFEPRVMALVEAYPDADDVEVQTVRALIAPADDELGDA
jgi:phage baseplate assembly protein W